MKLKNILFLVLITSLITSCAAHFKKGGYFLSKNGQSYYANDQAQLYINFSDKYYYTKVGFNTNYLSSDDVSLLEEFGEKPQHLLFSYHSGSGRQVITFLLNDNQIDLAKYQKSSSEESTFYYKLWEKQHYAYRINVYPYEKKWIKVIEKAPIYTDKNGQRIVDNKTRIFPKISNKIEK